MKDPKDARQAEHPAAEAALAAKAEKAEAAGVLAALESVDRDIIEHGLKGSAPGSGIKTLLELCANQFLGVPRS
jgi:hypothetical protein